MTPTPEISMQAALSGKRVLITGTTGFLAKVVLEKLIGVWCYSTGFIDDSTKIDCKGQGSGFCAVTGA